MNGIERVIMRERGTMRRMSRLRGRGAAMTRVLLGAAVLIVLAGAIAAGWKLSRQNRAAESQAAASSSQATAVVTPSAKVEATAAERQEVLKRIDVMPNISAENKERLYAQVEHAQSLKLIASLPFAAGQSRLADAAADKLEQDSHEVEFLRMARDPALVFVVLGFADKKGDEAKNLQVSLDRAESVVDVLRKRCRVLSVVQPIAMGSSDLFDQQNPAKNRIVEIWAVIP